MKDSSTYNDHQSESLSKQTWRKFKKNRLGMFGLILIVIATVISICGYLITPDSTPFANDQKPELHIKKPGFKVGMLMIKKNEATQQVSFFSKMLFGEVSDYSSIPYYSIKLEGFDVEVEEYTGNEQSNDGTITKYNLADVVYNIR